MDISPLFEKPFKQGGNIHNLTHPQQGGGGLGLGIGVIDMIKLSQSASVSTRPTILLIISQFERWRYRYSRRKHQVGIMMGDYVRRRNNYCHDVFHAYVRSQLCVFTLGILFNENCLELKTWAHRGHTKRVQSTVFTGRVPLAWPDCYWHLS